MAKKVILGTDIARDAFKTKVNDNFTELYDNIEDKLSTSHNTDANAHDDIRQQINDLEANKANRVGDAVIKIKRQYISVLSKVLTGAVYNKGTKIKTKIPYTAPSVNAVILTIKGTFGQQVCFITLQFYKPAGGLNAAFCKASSINTFKPEIKMANEGGYLVFGFTDTTFSYHSFAVDVFTPDSFTPEHFEGWTVVNEAIVGESPVTVAYV